MPICLPSFVGVAQPASGGGFPNEYSVSTDGSDDYIDCGTVTALNNATNFSLSMWVNFQTFVDNYVGYNIILGAGTVTGNRFLLNAVRNTATTANRFEVYFCDNVATIFNTSVGLTSNTWYHMGVYKSGADMSFYIDNTLIGSRSDAPDTGSGSNFAIGRGIYGGAYSSNILVDEVALWDSDQSSNRTSIYNGGVPSDISSLSPAHWWRMGDGSDGSGNDDGTLVNIGGTDFPQIYNVAEDGSGNRITGNDGSLTNIASPNGIVADVP